MDALGHSAKKMLMIQYTVNTHQDGKKEKETFLFLGDRIFVAEKYSVAWLSFVL